MGTWRGGLCWICSRDLAIATFGPCPSREGIDSHANMRSIPFLASAITSLATFGCQHAETEPAAVEGGPKIVPVTVAAAEQRTVGSRRLTSSVRSKDGRT